MHPYESFQQSGALYIYRGQPVGCTWRRLEQSLSRGAVVVSSPHKQRAHAEMEEARRATVNTGSSTWKAK